MGTFVFRLALCVLAISAIVSAAAVPAAYSTYCVNCHGEDGHGNPKAALKGKIPDLHSASVQDLTDNELYETIALGKQHREYPHAFLRRGLAERDIREIVTYIRSMVPQKKH